MIFEMPTFRVKLDFALAYLALSRDGRKFLRKQNVSGREKTAESIAFIQDRPCRRSLIRTLIHCDRMFFDNVSDSICRESGRDRAAIFARLVPFAWIGLEIRKRFMEAFGVEPGEDANRLLCLLIFVHREWDDLIDSVSPEELKAEMQSGKSVRPAFSLVHHLTNVHNKLARKLGCWEKMVAVWDKAMKFYDIPFVPEQSAEHLEMKASLSEEVHFAVLPELPSGLRQALRPFSIWLSSLDDTADVERDRLQNRMTYMTLVNDPVEESWKFEKLAEEAVMAAEPCDARGLFLLMRSMTADVADAVRTGRDIEHEFYSGPEKPISRNPDPSAPYRAGKA